MLEDLEAVRSVRLAPEGGGTVRALARIGYDLEHALADLIDNSIDAGAGRVEITLFRNDEALTSVAIADDGRGMTRETLQIGMQFAGRKDHSDSDLGVYGMGLKSASFSQCETLSVITRQGEVTSSARWSVEQIDKDWACELLDDNAAEEAFRRLCLPSKRPATGTLVVWDRLTRLGVGGGDEDLDTFLATETQRISTHLGLVFHRFLAGGVLSIMLTTRHTRRTMALPQTVRPLDPFDYPHSGAEGWPKELEADLPGLGPLSMTAHIWPANSQVDGYNLGSRNGGVKQGFYFYRNNRIIQAGGWNDVVRNNQDPELVLARVAVELPPGGFGVNVQKSGLQATASQAQAFMRAEGDGETFESYLNAAREALAASKRDTRAPKKIPLVPGRGLSMPVRRSALKALAGEGPSEEVDFVWADLEDDEFFRLDQTDRQVFLNRTYRREILGDAPASAADAPLIKMLLFLLFRGEFERKRFSRQHSEYVDTCNALLLDALRK